MSNYLNVNSTIPESMIIHPAYHPGIADEQGLVPKTEPSLLCSVSTYEDSNHSDQKASPSVTSSRADSRNRRQFETPEQREARLQRQREANRRRRENETEEQRALRLMANRRRLANESFEKRQARLADLSRRQKQRLANETPEQRAARLAYLSRRQKERRANIMATRERVKYSCNVQNCCRCVCCGEKTDIVAENQE